MIKALQSHWPEYLIEAWALGLFMVSACVFGVLLEHPQSPVRAMIGSAGLRRFLMGMAMGGTAVALIYSPWGQRSGAQMNPAATLTFLRLGRMRGADALGYVAAQFLGGVGGVWLAKGLMGAALAHPAVNHVATVPGPAGVWVAFGAEVAIAFGMMLLVLRLTNTPSVAPYTGWCVGALVCLYISLEAPLSGMSMNPARTAASAVVGGVWTSWWIYFSAPVLGMLAAAAVHVAVLGRPAEACPKIHHGQRQRCIFCGWSGAGARADSPSKDPSLVSETF